MLLSFAQVNVKPIIHHTHLSLVWSFELLLLLSFVRGGEQPQGEEGLGLGVGLYGGLAALVDFSSSGFLFSFGAPRPSFGSERGRVRGRRQARGLALLFASLALIVQAMK